MTQDYDGYAVAVKPSTPGTELTLAAAVPSWLDQVVQGVPKTKTFSEAGVLVGLNVSAYKTTGTIEIPIRSLTDVGAGRVVEFVVEPDGAFLTEPITLRARIEPKAG